MKWLIRNGGIHSHDQYTGGAVRKTSAFIFWGLAGAVLLLLPAIEYYNDIDIPFVGFPLDVLWQGASYLAIFFHEIGHAVFGWFYGYVSIPVFDFNYGGGVMYNPHGGGMTGDNDEPSKTLLLIVYLLLVYGLFLVRREKFLALGMAGLILFHLATAYSDYRRIVILFMGHGTEIVIGSFMIFRALFNLAPTGGIERYLNALFGFYFILSNMRNSYGLITSDIERAVYAQQKGGDHVGDFDRIALDYLMTDVQHVAAFALAVSCIALVIPFACYLFLLLKKKES